MFGTWENYQLHNVDPGTGKHKTFPEWTATGVWEFTRSDGLLTAHKIEAPYPDWTTTLQTSMKWADENIPLGAELPDGMRTRDDPLYLSLYP